MWSVFRKGGYTDLKQVKWEDFGFVNQLDLFIDSLTTVEHLKYVAALRMQHFTAQQRMERIDDILSQLMLSKCRNTFIGSSLKVKGLSGGEKRRLSFATATIHNPGRRESFPTFKSSK